MQHFTSFFLKVNSILLFKKVFFMLNVAFAMEMLDFTSRVHLVSFVITLLKYSLLFKRI
jgi:hypothetical protein